MDPTTLPIISTAVNLAFQWIMLGVCVIYGIRLYFNSVISPTFTPICSATFSTCISLILITNFKYSESPIRIKIPGLEIEGQAGQIVLWCLCYITISFGLKIVGAARQISADYDRRPLHKLWGKSPSPQQIPAE
jgi:hypothetical protein